MPDDFVNKNFKILQTAQENILVGENKSFSFQDKKTSLLFEKIKALGTPLGEFCSVNNGVNTGNAANILLSKEPYSDKYLKIIEGKDINRYSIAWNGNWINYDSSLKKTIKLSDL